MNNNAPLKKRIKLYGDDAYLSMNEAALFLNVHRVTLSVWRKKRPTQPPSSKMGKFVVYRLGDLKDYLNKFSTNAVNGTVDK